MRPACKFVCSTSLVSVFWESQLVILLQVAVGMHDDVMKRLPKFNTEKKILRTNPVQDTEN
eukprot:984759-Amphidinium_carterae.1